jgi:RNA 2',3'-cyclic 3'-phosphodiesterase
LESNEGRIPTSRRLFVGIALDEPVRAACASASESLRRTGFSAKLEGIDKLHVTLAFLGNVDGSRYESIVDAMGRTAAERCAFAVTLNRIGAFPHERKPRIVYVGARKQGAAFRDLSQRLRGAYAELGFDFKDDAVAHVTIARVKEPRRPLPFIEITPVSLRVAELTLFESAFDKTINTTRYIVSATARLGTPGSNEV